MKSILLILFLLFQSFNLIAQSYSGSTYQEASSKKSGEIVFLHMPSPYISEKQNNIRKGICSDIMNEFIQYVEKTKGIKLNVKHVDAEDNFPKFIKTVRESNGGVFGLGDVTITNERKTFLNFSPSYLDNFPVLVTNSTYDRFQNEAILFKKYEFKTAYTTKGTLHERRVLDLIAKYQLKTTVTYVPSSIEIIDFIEKDPSSFGLVDAIFYLDAVKKKMKISPQQIEKKESEEYGIIMPKNSDWATVMKDFFEHNGGFKNSSNYRKILSDNFGPAGAGLFKKGK
ncbi:transporter substrate-binding domain-containing protein [Cytophagales bacterium LB-30]|uniref:Transporter substrate-binding domain-containing protein n=1 Tax=Shiella aurantiaca TaxID=3058365 RepID=A0ABT8F4C1_9BACT|nr:transporter substrate-binding domain-containing protein [Shiella aurantiaca]MDN4165071.1 transporter substrate-binding domain-containing protein [Shiella aurantiaca]